MIGRKTAIGLALLYALLFSAFATQSALAQIGTPATNTTAFTCVKGGGNLDFKDPHCDEKVGAKEEGQFGHVAIESGETTAIELTNKETKNKTTEAESATFTMFLPGPLPVTCKTVSSPDSSWIENSENEGQHKVEGTAKIQFSKCEVLTLKGCAVKEPVEVIAKFKGVEGLKSTKEEETMGVEFTPDEGKTFVALTFENLEGKFCGLGKNTFPITGSVIGTGTPEPAKGNKHSGATSIFVPNEQLGTPAFEMETLRIGMFTASFAATLTMRQAGGGNPIALTTVT